ncbi:MAG: undecaprenyl/decaprenyl-phosphate alpha-N-acetylglucosaminyl 1-phosphate transferase [Anaerolineae bacterium]|nr:undecaprenyl/decaprenyl-phosphate alpha-N-acetylglucosaminyl 1-phosphate transferase [Anaerolineae bacterium]
MWTYLLVTLLSFIAALVFAPLAGLAGHRLGIVDRPGGRRTHARETPRLGGVALFAACTLAMGVMAWQGALTAGYGADDYTRLYGLLLGGVAAFLFGLIDDWLDLPPAPQFAFQFLLALIALASLLWLERFTLPVFGLIALSDYAWGPFIYVPLTIIWVMGMVNTVNWLDGLDGLAGGVGAILCLVLAVHMHRQGQHSVALLPLALLGALLGFLPYNVAPARIFLGSCGAFFLGYMLGGMGLIAGGRVATALLVMGLPVVDTAWTIFERLRQRRSPTQADRSHLHFRLLDLGLSQRTVVLCYWGFCALFGLLALTVSSRVYKLLALGALGIAVVSLLSWLSFRRK